MPAKTPETLFFCYAPEDEAFRKELDRHLSLLERQGYITKWSGQQITAGRDARAEIARKMAEARVILLLVSADFIASDELYDVALTLALEQRQRGALVFGVLLRPTDWAHGQLATLRMLPRPGDKALPVTAWPSHDDAFSRVAEELREELKDKGVVARISINPREAHPPSAPRG